jgi:signal transduction histidine kinase
MLKLATSAGSAAGAWDNVRIGDVHYVNWASDARWRRTMIVGGVLLLAGAHAITPPSKSIHNALFHLDIIPILIGGMVFGWRAVLWVAALIAVTELPQIWRMWPHDMVYVMDQVGELSVFTVAGCVVGYLADRQRRQREELQRTTLELEKVYVELQRNIERLTKAERLSAVAQLSASLAHEIRNPLAGISGAAGILRRGHGSQENVRDCVEIIEKESQRLNKLLTNFLEFARPRAPRLQPTDLGAVIDSVIALASHSAGASAITFHRRVAADLPEVQCDSEQLKQVLLNLVMNSIEASREGVIELRAEAAGESAILTVRDQGAGFPSDRRAQMFEPFFTTKDNGTGLGLAIAAKIVEKHGGALSASSVQGRGAEMVIQLPLRRGAAV